tara:strand:- start:545 stop:1414 length:870 start_codon:yes stop_codon:yes gene_type:complete
MKFFDLFKKRKKVKTIQSEDKDQFDITINKYLKEGWELVDGTYSVLSDGNIRQLISFEDKIESIDEIYYEEKLNQEVRRVGVLKNGKKTGLWKEFYENGNKWRVEEYKDGKLHGKRIGYFENGNVRGEGSYKNGEQLNGKFIIYWENGNKREVGNFLNKELDGLFYQYHEQGQLIEKTTFKLGVKNGEFIFYHENGNKRQVGNFKNNEKHGKVYQYYRSNEQLLCEVIYKDGIIDDQELITYHKSGCKLFTQTFKNGNIINEVIHYRGDDYWVDFKERELLFGNILIME